MAIGHDTDRGSDGEMTNDVDGGPGWGTGEQVSDRAVELRRVRDYFQATWLDYRVAWASPEVPALHMGYWDDSVSSHRESLTRTNDVLADRAGITAATIVFDAGCGVGGSIKHLERTRQARCLGATISMTQARKARELLDELETGGADRVLCADFADMPLLDESVDVVWTMEALCYDVDPRPFLTEAYRVLKPGGRVAIWDGFRTRRPLSAADEQLLHEFTTGWAVDDLSTMQEMSDYVAGAGFVDVEAVDCHDQVRRSLRRLNRLGILAAIPAWVLVKLGIRSKIQVKSHRAANLQWKCFQRSLWTMGTVVAVKPASLPPTEEPPR